MAKTETKPTKITVGKRYFRIANVYKALLVRMYHILGSWLLKRSDVDLLKNEYGHVPAYYRPSGASILESIRFAIA